jgi:hypothetical protein
VRRHRARDRHVGDVQRQVAALEALQRAGQRQRAVGRVEALRARAPALAMAVMFRCRCCTPAPTKSTFACWMSASVR